MLNQIQIIGNCGEKTYGNETAFNFSVATSEKWVDRNTGEEKQSTQWHKVVAFGKLAGICSQYINKGQQVYVSGKMEYSKYTDQQGQERQQARIIADRVQLLGKRELNRTDEQHTFSENPDIPF
jgi:single-strand DNA-binding protein